MYSMKAALFVVLSSSLIAGTSLADSMDANCVVHIRGDMKQDASGRCTVSQRQGNVGIELRNGEWHELTPGNRADHYTDEQGRKV